MPPAFNLSQDQTLQFNLVSCHLWQVRANRRSLKILTVVFLRTFLYFFCVSTCFYHLSIPAYQVRRRTPSSAHTYRLLVFKELQIRSASTADGPGLRSVVFVSSREMRL